MLDYGTLITGPGDRLIRKADNELRIATFLSKWSNHRSKEMLFPSTPKVADISQQSLGDCFLLSSLQSILHLEPDGYTIYRTMIDHRDGWITVRFHGDVDHGDRLEYNVKFQKTVPWFPGAGLLYSKGPLWVAMLEKAYAIAKWKGSYEASLSGGSPRKTLRMLTGRDTNFHDREAFSGDQGITELKTVFAVGNNTEHTQMAAGGHDIPAQRQQRAVNILAKCRNEVFNTSQPYLTAWMTYNDRGRLAATFDDFLKKHGTLIKKPGANAEAPDIQLRREVARFEQFEQWLDEHTNGLAIAVKECIKSYVLRKKIFPGKRGTGMYSAQDLVTFDYVKSGIAQKIVLTAGTYQQVGTSLSKLRGTVGESVSQGLVGSHMYSLLAAAEDQQFPNRRWIKLRNPWGRTVRAYVQDGGGLSLNAVELDPDPKQRNVVVRQVFVKPEAEPQSVVSLAQQGMFWIELSDFIKRFNKIQGGAKPAWV